MNLTKFINELFNNNYAFLYVYLKIVKKKKIVSKVFLVT